MVHCVVSEDKASHSCYQMKKQPTKTPQNRPAASPAGWSVMWMVQAVSGCVDLETFPINFLRCRGASIHHVCTKRFVFFVHAPQESKLDQASATETNQLDDKIMHGFAEGIESEKVRDRRDSETEIESETFMGGKVGTQHQLRPRQ